MSQVIYGSSVGQANDVSLQKDPKGVGDSLSVHLSQEPRSTAVWTLQVFVHLQQGTFFLGQKTIPVLTAASVSARTVIIANCPGATGWKVIATCPDDNEEAQLTLDSSKCCSNAIGVELVEPGGSSIDVTIVGPLPLPVALITPNPVPIIEADTPWLGIFSTGSGTLTNSFVISAVAGIIRSLTVRIDAALASGTYYLQLWNLAALPADGLLGTTTNWITSAVKVVHILGTDNNVVYNFNEEGQAFDTGAVLGLSSTAADKTNVAGNNLSVTSAEYRTT
jgi:hypothetical protein